MIGRLSGRLDHKAEDHVLIDVRGVGYLVYVSDRTMAGLPAMGAPVSLFTDLVVREDLMQLFGFPTLVEKEWHRLLTSVQGVGAKVSLAILGALGTDGLARAISLGDWSAVKAARGVGPKTAQRIGLELKDKAPAVMALGGQAVAAATAAEPESVIEANQAPAVAPSVPASATAQAEALSALTNLGYQPSEAAAAVATALADAPEAATGAVIRAALKHLAPKG
jgi:Holliday junction DNA helicase RuvA